jgi:hypothetical protein
MNDMPKAATAMTLELNSLVPLVTIIAAAAAPTIAAILAKRDARDAATKVSDVKEILVGTADRLTAATREIEELKRLVRELGGPPKKR